ncbi:hypothetical protein U9M48_006854 [Paspalum notatum var. saurae]|uniref:Uncharacterized protein n=1 Tax=Paspalum notatum var. saurae TaxID=547442 RepID=A0AAQ3PTA4_PASNO
MGTAAVVAGTAEELKEDNQECLAECDGHGDGEAPNLIEHGFEFLMNPQLEANPIADRFPSLILFFILPPDGNKLNLVHNENPFRLQRYWWDIRSIFLLIHLATLAISCPVLTYCSESFYIRFQMSTTANDEGWMLWSFGKMISICGVADGYAMVPLIICSISRVLSGPLFH